MAKSHLKLAAPTTEKRTVTPVRLPNAELRTRTRSSPARMPGLFSLILNDEGRVGLHFRCAWVASLFAAILLFVPS
jgi:hypothetical protein